MDFNEIYGQMQEFYATTPGTYTPEEAERRARARTDWALTGFAVGTAGAFVGPPRLPAGHAVAGIVTNAALLYLTRNWGRYFNFVFASGITGSAVTAVRAAINPDSVVRMGRTRSRAVANSARRRMIHARRGRLRAPGSPSAAIGGGDGDASIMVRSPSAAIGGGDGDASIMVHGGHRMRPEPPKPMNATLAFHPHHDTTHYRLPRSTSV